MRDATRFDQDVGRTIRRLRKGKSLTQGDLAAMLHLSRTSVTNIESGRQSVSLQLATQIASVLEVPITRLVPSAGDEQELKSAALLGLRPGERKVVQRMIRTASRS